MLLLLLSIASFLNRKQPVWLHVRRCACAVVVPALMRMMYHMALYNVK
jgi:hypothetical protein